MDADYAAALRSELLTAGAAILRTGDGKRLFLVHSTALSSPEQGLLMAYENGGVFFWSYATDPRPLNAFRLTGAGFTLSAADAVMQILEGINLSPDMLTHVTR